MFPGLRSTDVDDLAALPAALASSLSTDGPSVVSVECSADEIPPFANFLGNEAVSKPPITKEADSNVAART
jgi:acetolactate synthase-1/2/3 large subunit